MSGPSAGNWGQTPITLRRQSLGFDLRIFWMTNVQVLRRDGVSH
jgi:hypothetical protein